MQCALEKRLEQRVSRTHGEKKEAWRLQYWRDTNSPVLLMRGERRVVWERQWGDGPGNPPQRCDRRWPCPQLPQPHFALKTFPLTLSRFHQRGLDVRNLNFDQGSDRPRQRTPWEATAKLQWNHGKDLHFEIRQIWFPAQSLLLAIAIDWGKLLNFPEPPCSYRKKG